MWARTVEVMLACWLAMSPFIFSHRADQVARWATDLGCAALVVILSCASFWQPLRHLHLAILLPAFWLVGYGWASGGRPAPPALQNDILVGLFLLMMAILPTDIIDPPRAWRRWTAKTDPHRS